MNRESRQKQEFPGPDFHGGFKRFDNKHGFSVRWDNIDIRVKSIKPGIYIRLCRPDYQVKEEKYFPFGQEIQAEEEYQNIVKKLQEWDSVV